MDPVIKYILITFGVAVGLFLILEYIVRIRVNNYRWWIVFFFVVGVFILGVELLKI